TIGGNRDALDFPLFFALKDNLSSNGLQNDWRNVVNASQDVHDDGLANNGSQGVAFVQSHDDTGVTALPRVAHAYILMRPGDAVVYFNPQEFGPRGNNFPREGRLDALGGFYGQDITRLVNIRNTHGRGNYLPRVTEKELLAFERDRSAIVFLSNRGDVGFDTRAIQTGFAPGTRLIDLTGNATNPQVDPTNVMPDVVTVGAGGIATLTVKRNGSAGTTAFNDQGYVIYGLPTPAGSLSVTNVATTLVGATPSPSNNATNILTSMDVITSSSFSVKLNTVPVVLPDSTIDPAAGGDRAYLKINGGINVNGNAGVDFVDPGSTRYGFENFVTKNSPLFLGGDGEFIQTIDATALPEGPNYIEARAFRHRSDGGPDVFTSFRKVIYVDRVAPPSTIDSIVSLGGNNRQVRVRSVDQTADRAHIFLNQPAIVTDTQILAAAQSGTNQAGQIDRDIFAFGFSNVGSGNHVIHTVLLEPTGNASVTKTTGVYIQTGRGLGLGDLNFSNAFEVSDINGTQGMEILVYPNLQGQTNTQFNPAADVNGDGLLDTRDLLAIRAVYLAANAPAAVINEARNAELRRGNIDNAGGINGNAADIDFLYSRLGATTNIWRPDLNVDGAVTQTDVNVLVRQIFLTEYGDANLDRTINLTDFSLLAANFNLAGGWSSGNFNGSGGIDLGDFALLAANYNFVGTSGLPRSAMIPEPTGLMMLLTLTTILKRRRQGGWVGCD
ncbi:MAG: hypothetical protein NZ561_05155, partial [Phycisphaerae bacterium]|nr:hypothetical protein [Phycisphaerae bacterium]